MTLRLLDIKLKNQLSEMHDQIIDHAFFLPSVRYY